MPDQTDEPKRTAEEWLAQPEYEGLVIMDPDGWDRRPKYWEASWGERLTRNEFEGRVAGSTCMIPRRLLGLEEDNA